VSVVQTFANRTDAPAEVRRLVHAALEGLPREIVDDVAAMASELAANVVRHAATDFTVRIERDVAEVHVEVADTGGGRPVLRTPSTTDPTGRGLLIVSEMSNAWGVRSDPANVGKTVWFTVRAHGSTGRPAGDAASVAHAGDSNAGRPTRLATRPVAWDRTGARLS